METSVPKVYILGANRAEKGSVNNGAATETRMLRTSSLDNLVQTVPDLFTEQLSAFKRGIDGQNAVSILLQVPGDNVASFVGI